MSDVVREFIDANPVVITDDEILKRRTDKQLALVALDAERADHAMAVDRLHKRLREAILLLKETGISQLKQYVILNTSF